MCDPFGRLCGCESRTALSRISRFAVLGWILVDFSGPGVVVEPSGGV